MRVTRTISRCSGLGSSTTAWVSRAIPPISVCMPVARTTKVPLPATAAVPAKSSSCRSVMGTFSRSSPMSGSLKTGCDSPVSALWSTRSPAARRSCPSAGTWSPSSSSPTSPGTRSAVGTRRSSPSRRTVISLGRRSCSASTARSARYSWKKLNTPLITMTPKMAQPSSGKPAGKAKAPPTHRSTAKKLVNWSASRMRRGRPATRSSRLAPPAARRRAASPTVSPAGVDPSNASRTALGSGLSPALASTRERVRTSASRVVAERVASTQPASRRQAVSLATTRTALPSSDTGAVRSSAVWTGAWPGRRAGA